MPASPFRRSLPRTRRNTALLAFALLAAAALAACSGRKSTAGEPGSVALASDQSDESSSIPREVPAPAICTSPATSPSTTTSSWTRARSRRRATVYWPDIT